MVPTVRGGAGPTASRRRTLRLRTGSDALLALIEGRGVGANDVARTAGSLGICACRIVRKEVKAGHQVSPHARPAPPSCWLSHRIYEPLTCRK
jgi:hypothetical protein